MPGVTTAINAETPIGKQQQAQTGKIQKKATAVIATAQMDMHVPLGEGGSSTNTHPPLIDLTLHPSSPPPSSAASSAHTTQPQSLSSSSVLTSPSAAALTQAEQLAPYAPLSQTRVVTTVSPIQSATSPAMQPLQTSEHHPPAPQSRKHNEASTPRVFTSQSFLPPSAAPGSSSSIATSVLTHSQHPTIKSGFSRSAENPPPALVDYGDLPSLSEGSVLLTKRPQVKTEPPSLHYAANLTPSAPTNLTSSAPTNLTPTLPQHTAVVVHAENLKTTRGMNQVLNLSSLQSSVSQAPRTITMSSGRMSQVGVVSPQVGVASSSEPLNVDFPPLRIKYSVGDETEFEAEREEREQESESEEGTRDCLGEGEEEDEDTESVMELRIEEPISETTGKNESGHSLANLPGLVVGGGGGMRRADRGGVEEQSVDELQPEEGEESNEEREVGEETESIHVNSVGTSPSPLMIEVGGHDAVGSSAGTSRPMEEDDDWPDTRNRSRGGLTELRSHISVGVGTGMASKMEIHGNGKLSPPNSNSPGSASVLKNSSKEHTERISCTVSAVSSSPSLLLRDGEGGGGEGGGAGGAGRERDRMGLPVSGHNGEVSVSYRVRKVAKVKQFFTTLQHFGNKQSSEVAEQVQELIAALVNGTASIEEFHQEIQTVTNHPLRQFIIPFLKENLDLFREELRDSQQALSDILGHPTSSSPPTTISLTPHMIDDDLPVLSSSKPTHVHTHTSTTITSSTRLTVEPPTHASPILSAGPPVPVSTLTPQQHRSTSAPSSQSHTTLPITSTTITTTTNFDPSDVDPAHFSPAHRKRQRRTSTDKAPITMDTASSFSERSSVKRPRHDHSSHTYTPSVSMDTVVVSPASHRAPPAGPSYPPLPPTLTSHQQLTYTPSHSPHDIPSHPHTLTTSHLPTSHLTAPPHHASPSHKQLLSEDWVHVDMMLNSVVGMVDKVRHAVNMLRERALNSNADFEKKELEQEHITQQRVAEATEKARRQWQEEKQRILQEANRQMKEAVGQVKTDIEQKIAQAQSLAVQEALKEANVQNNSKENCWNCGRRATETCSGCNKARYCGTYCQHKDWGNHMHQCASGLIGISEERSASAGPQHIVIQSGDTRMMSSPMTSSVMTSSDVTNEQPDIKPRISPEQLMSVPQINIRYPLT